MTRFIMLTLYTSLFNLHRPWKSQQSIEDELVLHHPVSRETEHHKATCQRAVKANLRADHGLTESICATVRV